MERVAIYNRCSTEEEAQRNALEIQAKESREIAKAKGWQITAQYVESESGTTTKKRLAYQRMMEDIEDDGFDIIMIKSIDRLMRSTKDWYLFIDKVVSFQKKLFIYMDNKFYEPEDAFITGIKAILAEDFSRELSKKIKHAHKRRQENKLGINFTKPIFGWDKVSKDTYIINEEEAKWYRLAFTMAEEGYGFYSIAKYMYAQGVRSKTTGNRISEVQWRNMLYSPRAYGTVILHQREYDFYTKKYIKIPKEQWIYMENALPAIVSKEYQDKVISVIKERAMKPFFQNSSFQAVSIGSNFNRYFLSGKLYCACCGSVYHRIIIHKGEKGQLNEWKCGKRIREGRNACENKNVIEESILDAIEIACEKWYQNVECFDDAVMVFQKNISNFQEQEKDAKEIPKKNYFLKEKWKYIYIEKTMKILQKIIENHPFQKEITRLEKEMQEQQRKKLVLLDKLANEVIEDHDFQLLNSKLSTKIKELEQKIEKINLKNISAQEKTKRLQKIQKILQDGEIIKKAQLKTWMKNIEKITICADNQLEVQFRSFDIVSETVSELHTDIQYQKIDDKGYFDEYVKKQNIRIMVPYVHKNHVYQKKEQVKRQILEIFRENPHMKLKDIIPMFDVKASYINECVKQLKQEGKLVYQRGTNHSGNWSVM